MQIRNYVDDTLLNMRLIDLRCKHAMHTSYKADEVIRLSSLIGYDIAEWGLHSNHVDIQYHVDVIMKMEEDDYNHPLRIVICKYDFQDEPCIWIDNIHSAVRYVRQHGHRVKLRDVPFYIVDITGDYPVISENGTRLIDMKHIDGAVDCAYKRLERSDLKELVDLNYKFGEFLLDNPVLLTCRSYFGTDGATRGPKKGRV